MIVLPMAGLSQRFIKAGYTLPKYMLTAGANTVFSHVLQSFEHYFTTEPFLFICRDVMDTPDFIRKECKQLGINEFQLAVLDAPTQGQAETVWLGLQQAKTEEKKTITIFNIDTIRPHFRFPAAKFLADIDGFIEVFRGQGDNWSFAKTETPTSMKVIETSEKRRISELCSTGLYHFARCGDFMEAFEDESKKPKEHWDAQELYVAPLYNFLIKKGAKIMAVEIAETDMIPCGIPSEYESYKMKFCS